MWEARVRRYLFVALLGLSVCGCNEPTVTAASDRPVEPSCDGVAEAMAAKHQHLRQSPGLKLAELRMCSYALNHIWEERQCSVPTNDPPVFDEWTYGLRQETRDAIAESDMYVTDRELAILKWEIQNKSFIDHKNTDSCLQDIHDATEKYNGVVESIQSLRRDGY